MGVFRTCERSTFLIGHIGQQLSRMRLLLREQAPDEAPPRLAFLALDATLEASSRELSPLLSGDEAQLWTGLAPRIQRLRDDLFRAISAQERGQSDRGSGILDQVVPDASEIMNALALLNRMNREGTEVSLREADARLATLRFAELAVSGVLALGITITWCIVIRLVRSQRHQLDQHLRRIESANADLNAFAGRISHDLRDVLSPVLLVVGTLRRLEGRAEAFEATSNRLERATSRALGLLDALLTFSRAGQASESNEVCSPGAELSAALEELAPLAERVGAHVELVAGPADDSRIRCSAGLVGIIFRNIIGNALKYVDGRPQRRVRIRLATKRPGWCEVSIADTGPGIPGDALPRIFEPFYRVPGTHVSGTGVGLATVQRVVRAHGGQVVVHSRVGEGTTFEVWLPIVNDPSVNASHANRGARKRPA
jgi:signal transduction histidine kinase